MNFFEALRLVLKNMLPLVCATRFRFWYFVLFYIINYPYTLGNKDTI